MNNSLVVMRSCGLVLIFMLLAFLPAWVWAPSSANYQIRYGISEGGGTSAQSSSHFQSLGLLRYHSINVLNSASYTINEGFIRTVFLHFPPTLFSLLTPGDGESINTLTPTMTWQTSYSPEPGGSITYFLWYADNPEYTNRKEVDNLTSPTYTVAEKLADQTVYYWKVKAIDKRGLNTWSKGSPWQFMVDMGEAVPCIVSFSPTDEAIGVPTDAKITVQFNKKMNQDSIQNSVEGAFSVTAIRDKNGKGLDQDVSGTFAWSENTLTFTPNSAWTKNYTYRVQITTGAKDFGGRKLAKAKTWNFSTVLDYLTSNVVVANDGLTKVGLSPLAFDKDAYIHINLDPIDHPRRIDPGTIIRANTKVLQEGSPFHYPLTDTVTEINPYDSRDNLLSVDFKEPVTLAMPFKDADNDGFVDGTTPPIKAENLLIYHLNEVDALWVRMPDSTVNRLPNTSTNINTSNVNLLADINIVFAPVVHFSGVYVLMSTPATDLTMAYAYPVPFKPSAGHTKIVFTNLASECTIRIFTVSGGLVRTMKEDSGTGQHSWDVKTDSGADVASGVYFYLIQSASDKKMGKLIIIR